VKEFDEELAGIRGKGLFRQPVYITSSLGSKIVINGHEYINFSSNNYLGLSDHPKIVHACKSALEKYGFGSCASRLLSGSYIPHKKLEEKIAHFKKTEASLVFNTGYAANTGIIPVLVSARDSIFSDELNHASIVDGVRLSKAKIHIYKHRDADHLEKLLKKSSGKPFIITDTIFSMDGDIAPLKDIVFLSKQYNAVVMVDDAHGTGVLGKTGRGGLEHFGIDGKDIIQMGTLSKACGCFGGFVAGSRDSIDFLLNKARSFMYSTSLPPALAYACIEAINIVRSESHILRKRLWKNREKLYEGLKTIGYDTLGSETPIIPLLAGDVQASLKIGNYLYKKKIFAPAIRPPTVPEEKCRIRFSLSAVHTEEEIDFLLQSLKKFSTHMF
jgi:8-amino-7-oxononanoate synthase